MRPLTSKTSTGAVASASARPARAVALLWPGADTPSTPRAIASLRTNGLRRGSVDLLEFFAAARLLIVAGKGGVGKTTVTAALASSAARAGLRTLVVEVEGKSGLAGAARRPGELGYDEVMLRPGGWAPPRGPSCGPARSRPTTPWSTTSRTTGMRRLSNRLGRIGRARHRRHRRARHRRHPRARQGQAARAAGAADLIVLDAPAAGHAITFLQSARGLLDAVDGRARSTPRPATSLEHALRPDPLARCVLVTLPEETPVNELVDTAFALEDRVGVSLGPVVVNGLYPRARRLDVDPLAAADDGGRLLRRTTARRCAAAAAFRRDRLALQHEQVARLGDGCRCPRSTCRSCSRPISGRPTSTRWPATLASARHRRDAAGVTGAARRPRRPSARILICCGSGGVGKTTTAAASPWRRPAAAAGPSSSPSIRPSAWPTPSGWRTG